MRGTDSGFSILVKAAEDTAEWWHQLPPGSQDAVAVLLHKLQLELDEILMVPDAALRIARSYARLARIAGRPI